MGEANNDATLQHAQSHVEFLLENSPLYAHLFGSISVTNASPSRVLVRLPLQQIHLNSKGGLHGSVSATLVDFIGGLAIACSDQRFNTGVSTDMHISFVGSARAGDVLEIEGRAEKVGGTLAFTRATIRKESKGGGEGDMVAIGSHTKFVKQR